MAYKDPADPRAREAKLRHYRKNKEVYKAKTVETRARNKAITDEAKSKPCADCGVEHPPWVMQFDHVGTKDRNVSLLSRAGVSVKRLLTEIAECEVVCANCHAERSHQRMGMRLR